VLLASIGSAFWYRDLIMDRVPETEPAFALIGLGPMAATEEEKPMAVPEAPGAGLQLQVSAPAYKTRDGKSVVIIKGFVVNISEKARAVPDMVVKVFNKNKKVLYEKRFAPTSPKLQIKERIAFSTELVDPPSAGTGMLVTFTTLASPKTGGDRP